MKNFFGLISIFVLILACEDEVNESKYDILINNKWEQFIGTYNDRTYALKEYEELAFNKDNSFYILKPILTENDSIYGSFELISDSIIMDSYRNLLTPIEVNGQLDYKDTIINWTESWKIILINYEFLEVEIDEEVIVFSQIQ
jgi:hypothetical protein